MPVVAAVVAAVSTESLCAMLAHASAAEPDAPKLPKPAGLSFRQHRSLAARCCVRA